MPHNLRSKRPIISLLKPITLIKTLPLKPKTSFQKSISNLFLTPALMRFFPIKRKEMCTIRPAQRKETLLRVFKIKTCIMRSEEVLEADKEDQWEAWEGFNQFFRTFLDSLEKEGKDKIWRRRLLSEQPSSFTKR